MIYIDRNGNGDLTEPGEKVAWKPDAKTIELGSIHGPDGKARYKVSLRKFPASVRLTVSDELKQRYVVRQKAAQTAELLSRRRFYAAQVNLAYQAWEAGEPARAGSAGKSAPSASPRWKRTRTS